MYSHAFVILSFLLFTISVRCDKSVCSRNSGKPEIVPDPEDCGNFYICFGDREMKIACATKNGPRKVFDPKSRTCVLQGSEYDHSLCNTAEVSTAQCSPGLSTVTPDVNNCAKYFRCSGGLLPVSAECPYPRLFDPSSQSCLLYLFVDCRGRREPKDPCDYEANQCRDSACVPCRARFGTCTGLPDGPNPWDGKFWTPQFVICRDQRVILHGDCRQHHGMHLFNPVTRQCSSMTSLISIANSLSQLPLTG